MTIIEPKSDQFLMAYRDAVSLFQKSDIVLAKEKFEQLSLSEPDNIPVLHNLSACYMKMKQYDDAGQTLDKMIELCPTEPDAYFMAGKVASLNGQFSEAVGYFEYALKYGFNKHTGVLARGIAYHGNKNIPEALNDFDTILQQTPDNALCLQYRLSCLISLQKFSLAVAVIEQLESLGVNSADLSAVKETCKDKCQTAPSVFNEEAIPITEV